MTQHSFIGKTTHEIPCTRFISSRTKNSEIIIEITHSGSLSTSYVQGNNAWCFHAQVPVILRMYNIPVKFKP